MARTRLGVLMVALASLGAASLAGAEPITVRIALSEDSPPNSHLVNGEAKGMFVELLGALFQELPGYRLVLQAYPWARAQLLVRSGEMDGFCTFPSAGRQEYASFAPEPLFVWDYGNLVFVKDNPKRAQIEGAKGFEDLKGLVFVSQQNVDWEKENVPAFLERYFVVNLAAMFQMTFYRKAGDFFIMSSEQALYYARELGFEKALAMRQVAFIPNSKVEFHLGLRKGFAGGDALLAQVAQAMRQPRFLAEQAAIIKKYSSHS